MINPSGSAVPARYVMDTNICLRLTQPGVFYKAVRDTIRRIETAGGEVWLVSQCLVELWSVVTRPVTANGLGLSPTDADNLLTGLEATFPRLSETPDIYPLWRSLVVATGTQGKTTHDARIVAAMQAHGINHLLTLNPGDFKRFESLASIVVLTP